MTRRRTALYIDFDNIFIELINSRDTDGAGIFTNQPRRLIEQLELPDANGDYREFLVRRCYMNFAGKIRNMDTNVHYKFRQFLKPFREAGFELIDCTSMTRELKNGADIRITIDVMNALQGPTHYDEFFIMSGDSDFTPLLHHLRTQDRVTSIFSIARAPGAYADRAVHVFGKDLLDPLRSVAHVIEISEDEDGEDGDAEVVTPPVEMVVNENPHAEDIEKVRDVVLAVLSSHDSAQRTSALGAALASKFGFVLDLTGYFGFGSLSALLEGLNIENLRLARESVWLDGVHADPNNLTSLDGLPAELIEIVRSESLPRLTKEQWRVVFAALSRVGSDPTTTNLAPKALANVAREYLAARGIHIDKANINDTLLVIKTRQQGTLRRASFASAITLRDDYCAGIENARRMQGAPLDDATRALLREWIDADDVTPELPRELPNPSDQ